jgi:hypothetical protein
MWLSRSQKNYSNIEQESDFTKKEDGFNVWKGLKLRGLKLKQRKNGRPLFIKKKNKENGVRVLVLNFALGYFQISFLVPFVL